MGLNDPKKASKETGSGEAVSLAEGDLVVAAAIVIVREGEGRGDIEGKGVGEAVGVGVVVSVGSNTGGRELPVGEEVWEEEGDMLGSEIGEATLLDV